MLSQRHRLRSSRDFSRTVRAGRRAAGRLVVLHLREADQGPGAGDRPAPARAGLVVSRVVGGSVVRHRVSRRLRHLLRERVLRLPGGARLVVRALPAAATATSAELADDLDRVLARTRQPRTARRPRS